MSLLKQVRTASKWSALAEISSKAISPLVFLLLARLLAPEDFGLLVAGTVIISLSVLICETGLNAALIQGEFEDEDAAACVVFWLNLAFGAVGFVAVYALAPWLAELFSDERATAVIRVLGLQMLLFPFLAVHRGLLEKRLDFRSLFKLQLTGVITPGLIAIPLAFSGAGYWSLVAGALGAYLAQTAQAWRINPWRPQLRFSRALARRMAGFSAWVGSGSLLGWFFSWGDSFVVGAALGAAILGEYRYGSMIVLSIFTVLMAPIQPLLFSVYSRLQSEPERLARAVHQTAKVLCLVALPVGAALFVFAEQLTDLLLTDAWSQMATIIAWLGLSQGLSWIIAAYPPAYKAVGRADINVKLGIALIFLYLPVYLLTIPHGMETFLKARVLLVIAVIPVHLALARVLLKQSFRAFLQQVKWPLLGAATAGVVAAWVLRELFDGPLLVQLLAGGLAGLVAYAACISPEWAWLRSTWQKGPGQV